MSQHTSEPSSVEKAGLNRSAGLAVPSTGNPGTPGRTRATFNDQELAEYLGISRKTLQTWRSLGLGPNYLKLGAKVVYRIEDVNAYVRRSLRIQRP
jgi:hypothetical protein